MTSAHCMGCGRELPLWFTTEMTDDEDDAAYEQWLDAPCLSCGAWPRQFLPTKTDKTH